MGSEPPATPWTAWGLALAIAITGILLAAPAIADELEGGDIGPGGIDTGDDGILDTPSQALTPPDGFSTSGFGADLDVNGRLDPGHWLAVAADEGTDPADGKVFLYERNSSDVWKFRQAIDHVGIHGTPSDVSIDGDTLAVVSHLPHTLDDEGSHIDIYVRQEDDTWERTASIEPWDGLDTNPVAVDVSGDHLAFSSKTQDGEKFYYGVYERAGDGTWDVEEVKRRDAAKSDIWDVDIKEATVNRAIFGDSVPDNIYVWREDPVDGWSEDEAIGKPGDENPDCGIQDDGCPHNFGATASLAPTAEHKVVGGADKYDNWRGKAWAFVDPGSGYTFESSIEAADGADNDRFGFDAEAYDGSSASGAPWHDASGKDAAGAVYLFLDGVQEGKVVHPDPGKGDELGWSVHWHQEFLVAGAPGSGDGWVGIWY